jgi:hypothetical protein
MPVVVKATITAIITLIIGHSIWLIPYMCGFSSSFLMFLGACSPAVATFVLVHQQRQRPILAVIGMAVFGDAVLVGLLLVFYGFHGPSVDLDALKEMQTILQLELPIWNFLICGIAATIAVLLPMGPGAASRNGVHWNNPPER